MSRSCESWQGVFLISTLTVLYQLLTACSTGFRVAITAISG